MAEPHLAETHEQYLDGFPDRIDDSLLGHWKTPTGMVIVEHHPHGYEVHINPCYDFANCEACSPHIGPKNPHTNDGHHFRECENHGPILTVAGGPEGYAAVLEYLAIEGSREHVAELERRRQEEQEAEREFRKREREEHERQILEQQSVAPSPAERLGALEAEVRALREMIDHEEG